VTIAFIHAEKHGISRQIAVRDNYSDFSLDVLYLLGNNYPNKYQSVGTRAVFAPEGKIHDDDSAN
jgi:hypothetical protein